MGPQKQKFNDPFAAGQLVGMMVILTFIERDGGISEDMLYQLKFKAADELQGYFNEPTEDICLKVEKIVDERCTI